jgi:putative ABC transport system ATP-binding protein
VVQVSKLDIASGERVFLHGPSGSGKSTLLALIGGLYAPQSGSVEVLGSKLSAMSQSERDKFRARDIGFIFQVFNLVPYLDVIENVVLPIKFGRQVSKGFSSAKEEAKHLLNQLGLGPYLETAVTELSIGQQQRVAVARALIGSPGLIIADEPTSALDADARQSFLDTLRTHVKASSSAVLFVSHDRSLASAFDRSLSLVEINRASFREGGAV